MPPKEKVKKFNYLIAFLTEVIVGVLSAETRLFYWDSNGCKIGFTVSLLS